LAQVFDDELLHPGQAIREVLVNQSASPAVKPGGDVLHHHQAGRKAGRRVTQDGVEGGGASGGGDNGDGPHPVLLLHLVVPSSRGSSRHHRGAQPICRLMEASSAD